MIVQNSADYYINEFAEYLGVHRNTVSRWIHKGTLPSAYKLGGRWRIPHDALDQIKKRQVKHGYATL